MNPRNDWQVTVQAPLYATRQGGEVEVLACPGYVQVDDVSGGRNRWSKGPQALRSEGVAVPDFHTLPSGRYTWAEAEFRLWLRRFEVKLGGWCALVDFTVSRWNRGVK